jgi:hypothetical protein
LEGRKGRGRERKEEEGRGRIRKEGRLVLTVTAT